MAGDTDVMRHKPRDSLQRVISLRKQILIYQTANNVNDYRYQDLYPKFGHVSSRGD